MGAVLPKPVTTKVLERMGNEHFTVGACSMNGFRENMEDAHCIHFETTGYDWGMFGIFDGHVNEKCSAFVGKELPLAVSALGHIPLSEVELQNVVLKVDERFGEEIPDGGSTGTFVIAHIQNNEYKLQIGNVGDSRVLLSRNGECEVLTSDHKPDTLSERQRIENCGGTVENGRVDGSLAVSRAFGDMDYKRRQPLSDQLNQKVIALPDITYTNMPRVCNADYILLCCDGVYEGDFTNEQIIEFANDQMKHTDDLAAVCAAICDEALLRGSKDNISCMIVQCFTGVNFTTKYPTKHECIPGPFSAPTSNAFVTAYKKMLVMGNMTLPAALYQRYQIISSLIPKLTEKYATIKSEDMTSVELRSILQPMYMTPGQRVAWAETPIALQIQQLQQKKNRGEDCTPSFLTEMQAELDAFEDIPSDMSKEQALIWLEEWSSNKMSNMQENEVVQRLMTLQQQLGLPMHRLLNLLQRDGPSSGGRGPGI